MILKDKHTHTENYGMGIFYSEKNDISKILYLHP